MDAVAYRTVFEVAKLMDLDRYDHTKALEHGPIHHLDLNLGQLYIPHHRMKEFLDHIEPLDEGSGKSAVHQLIANVIDLQKALKVGGYLTWHRSYHVNPRGNPGWVSLKSFFDGAWKTPDEATAWATRAAG